MAPYSITRNYQWFFIPVGSEIIYLCPTCKKKRVIASTGDLAITVLGTIPFLFVLIIPLLFKFSLLNMSGAEWMIGGVALFVAGCGVFQIFTTIRDWQRFPRVKATYEQKEGLQREMNRIVQLMAEHSARLRSENDDLILVLDVAAEQIERREKLTVFRPPDDFVDFTLPAGAAHGTRVRMKGLGLEGEGDYYVVLNVVSRTEG